MSRGAVTRNSRKKKAIERTQPGNNGNRQNSAEEAQNNRNSEKLYVNVPVHVKYRRGWERGLKKASYEVSNSKKVDLEIETRKLFKIRQAAWKKPTDIRNIR